MSENNIQSKVTACFTGHRSIDRKIAVLIPGKLKEIIEDLIKKGIYRFKAGGAIGFDTIAALCVLELQEQYPDIQLVLVLPCKDQTRNWNSSNTLVYNYILSKASEVEYVSEHFTSWCMHERNRRLVNGSSVCIAYLASSNGGTAYTYNYALQNELDVINVFDCI